MKGEKVYFDEAERNKAIAETEEALRELELRAGNRSSGGNVDLSTRWAVRTPRRRGCAGDGSYFRSLDQVPGSPR